MLGWPEIAIIGGVLFIFFGPKRLPEFARSVGEGIKEFKKATEEGLHGTSTSTVSAPPVKACANCGNAATDQTAAFCSKCGKPYQSPPPTS